MILTSTRFSQVRDSLVLVRISRGITIKPGGEEKRQRVQQHVPRRLNNFTQSVTFIYNCFARLMGDARQNGLTIQSNKADKKSKKSNIPSKKITLSRHRRKFIKSCLRTVVIPVMSQSTLSA